MVRVAGCDANDIQTMAGFGIVHTRSHYRDNGSQIIAFRQSFMRSVQEPDVSTSNCGE